MSRTNTKSQPTTRYRRGRPLVMLVATVVALLMASAPMSVPAIAEWRHNTQINSLEYKQQYGYWDVLELPEEFRTNSIHAAILPTGKVLLVAGSGNNRDNFNAFYNDAKIAVLKTVVLDPETMAVKIVPTPSDMFCSGHALLQNGDLLIAGGTVGYELLPGEVKKPAGIMILHNENPDGQAKTFAKGTRFTSPAGKAYVSTQEITLEPATKIDRGKGNVTITASAAKVFVEAVAEDTSYITDTNEQYTVEGLTGTDTRNIYGQGGPMTLNKQDFRGDNQAFEFDPIREEYVKVGDMHEGRWYPSLPVMNDGRVLAVSGLDNTGTITETTEWYDPKTKQWSWGINHAFPSYPALFRTQNPNVLFFSGSNAGYGPADKGRDPGFWNLQDNSFKPVSGLRDPDILETSASVMLPPTKGSNDGSQSQRIMVAGGGGIGESPLVTARTDIIDLNEADPMFTPGPNLLDAIRYVNMTVTPWDEIFVNGGTHDYRAKGNSYSFKSYSINPTNNEITRLADEQVGRSYHSGSLLLRDGRILVFGSDPLFGDKNNTVSGKFEQRLEIYTPPQFFRGTRPNLNGVDFQGVSRGQTLSFTSENANSIKTARLIPPSSSTHVTNIEQRSVGAIVKTNGNKVTIDLPKDENTLPNGWYMLFVVNADGLPSTAKMVQVIR